MDTTFKLSDLPGSLGHECPSSLMVFNAVAGHARVYCSFDVLYRLLTHLGYSVTYVRNFTDIDDKIIRRATELGEDPLHLSQR